MLLNLGVASLLFSALYVVQRYVLDRRIDAVEQSLVTRTDEAVEDLRSEFKLGLSELSDALEARGMADDGADDALLSSVREQPTVDSMQELFWRGLHIRALSTQGVRAEIPGTGFYLRLIVNGPGGPESGINVRLEVEDGSEVSSYIWGQTVPAVDMLNHFRDRLNRETSFVNTSVDSALIRIVETVATALHSRTGRGPGQTDLGPVIEQIDHQWCITDDGLKFIGGHRYLIAKHRVHEEDWYSHVSGKQWSDADQFWHALSTARLLWPEPSS